MYVFRLHVRPGGGSASMADTFAYCLREGILGVGWRTASNTNTTDWDTYFNEATVQYGKVNVCSYIKRWVGPGDLVWTRDTQGNYYIARVQSGWEYFTTPEARQQNIDIGNVFRVAFERLNVDEVPGKVVASFRPARTMQEIADPTAIAYSKFLWNQRAGAEVYALDDAVTKNPDIFSLLDAEEVEDVVFLYLQSLGWYVVPNSRKADTMAFEYTVLRPEDGKYAQVQVKTGGTSLHHATYRDLPFQVILFQSSGRYEGEAAANVTCLSRQEVETFLASSVRWLPARYRNKLAMLPTG